MWSYYFVLYESSHITLYSNIMKYYQKIFKVNFVFENLGTGSINLN